MLFFDQFWRFLNEAMNFLEVCIVVCMLVLGCVQYFKDSLTHGNFLMNITNLMEIMVGITKFMAKQGIEQVLNGIYFVIYNIELVFVLPGKIFQEFCGRFRNFWTPNDDLKSCLKKKRRNSTNKRLRWRPTSQLEETNVFTKSFPVQENFEEKYNSLNDMCAFELGRLNYMKRLSLQLESNGNVDAKEKSGSKEICCPLCTEYVNMDQQKYREIICIFHNYRVQQRAKFEKSKEYRLRNSYARILMKKKHPNSPIPILRLFYSKKSQSLVLPLSIKKQKEIEGAAYQKKVFKKMKNLNDFCPICSKK